MLLWFLLIKLVFALDKDIYLSFEGTKNSAVYIFKFFEQNFVAISTSFNTDIYSKSLRQR